MRRFAFFAAVPLALGCGQQSVSTTPGRMASEAVSVRMLPPARGALRYSLSEPAYVAVFAVNRGSGISIVLPSPDAEMDFRRRPGLNEESLLSGSRRIPVSTSRQESSPPVPADAFYVIASRHPLPIKELLGSPGLLARATGGDAARATKVHEALDALAGVLTRGVPADAWDADIYVYPPSRSASRRWRDRYDSCVDERALLTRPTLRCSLPIELRTSRTPLQ